MTFASYWKATLKKATWTNYGTVPPIWILGMASKRTNVQYGVGIRSTTKEYDLDHDSKVLMKKEYGEFVLYERTQSKLDDLETDLETIIEESNDPTSLTDAEVLEDLDRPAQFQLIITAERLV